MGLLAAAATLVEALALYVLPGRSKYTAAMIDTVDVGDAAAAAAADGDSSNAGSKKGKSKAA
jgi:hypothetical protein